jgi:hypothetical protein
MVGVDVLVFVALNPVGTLGTLIPSPTSKSNGWLQKLVPTSLQDWTQIGCRWEGKPAGVV